MAPIVHGLEHEFSEQMRFTYLDLDDPATHDFRAQLEFTFRPYFVLLDAEGNILQRWTGPVSEEEFRAAFEEALAEGG